MERTVWRHNSPHQNGHPESSKLCALQPRFSPGVRKGIQADGLTIMVATNRPSAFELFADDRRGRRVGKGSDSSRWSENNWRNAPKSPFKPC